MNKSKKTIKRRILMSHISIIAISVVLTSLIFNLCLNIYMRIQTRNQLLSAAQIVQKSFTSELLNTQGQGIPGEEKEGLKALLKINRVLKQTQTFLDINYAFVGVNGRAIYPKESVGTEEAALNEFLPTLKKKTAAFQRKNRVLYFQEGGKKYAALVHYVSGEEGKKLGSLVLYSDLESSRRLMLSVNAILFSILLLTALIALYVSNRTSKKISKPIWELGRFAKKIGDRKYMTEPINCEEEEIVELAKAMEQMAEKLQAYDTTMKTFLQNASHELRTPLMSIQGYAEGIKHGVVEDKEGAADIIIEESKRLTTIVEDLLYLSKLDVQQEKLKLETLKTYDFFKECIERVNGIALQKGIKISLVTEGETLSFIADEEKLSRAIINILGNCLRYAEKEMKVEVQQKGNNIAIAVKDDGHGFAAEDIPNIFDRFFKGKGGKYGLGLAITKTIIEKHGGSIAAENGEAGGACFNIRLTNNVQFKEGDF